MKYGKDFHIDYGPLPGSDGRGWILLVIEHHGYEHTHVDLLTEAQAIKLAARVERAIEARGIEALNPDLWNTRTIYGSKAYQDEDAGGYFAWREREDDRLGLG